MSRIGKHPVVLGQGVQFTLADGFITVKGPKGTVRMHVLPLVSVEEKDGQVSFRQVDESRDSNMNCGTQRALVNDMVIGVTKGFEKKLNLVGVGFRAQAQGDKLVLNVGFSHSVEIKMPEGITVKTPTQTEILVSGANKQQVGQIAAVIRDVRPPEPYKGKGIRYDGEHVVIKETKKK